MPYNAMGTRAGTGADLPQQLSTDILDDIRETATVMKLGRTIRTNTRDSRIPVLAQDVDAYWVNGDSGLKGATAPQWQSKSVYAEELAVIVPVPDAILDDADLPIWSEVRPLVARAFARRLDAAAIFGTNKPNTWSPSLVEIATTASATVPASEDPAADLLGAAALVADQELSPTHAAVRNGYEYRAAITRTQAFQANPLTDRNPFPLSIAGMPISTKPAYWDATKAEAIIADWGQVIVGVRQDLSMEIFREGIITNESGQVVTNLMQQDTSAARFVMRVGVFVRQPVIGTNTPTVPVAIVEPSV